MLHWQIFNQSLHVCNLFIQMLICAIHVHTVLTHKSRTQTSVQQSLHTTF